jgi:hypothetical protein
LIETKVLHLSTNVTNLQGYYTPLIETKVLHLYTNVTNLQGYHTPLIETKVYIFITRNVCISKYARLYKLSNGIMVMTPK